MIDSHILITINNAIKEKNLIVFVGAGLSINVGLPDWKRLVINIINELSVKYPDLATLENPLRADILSPLQTLSLIENKYKPDIYKIINENINNIPNDLDFVLHRKISLISEKIVTTNYDKIIEFVNPSLKVISYKSAFGVSSIHNNEKYVFKMHGTIDVIEDCIIFESQYKQHYNSDNVSSFELKKLFSEKTFLFIGFSMKDPYIAEMFNFIERLYDKNINKHFIFTTDATQYRDLNYLEPIVIDDNKNLDIYLDEIIINSETNNSITISKTDVTHTVYSKEYIKIVVLYISPIDKDIIFNTNIVTDCFNNLEIELSYLFLNTENLSKIIEYDYTIIFSQLSKNKLLIEDEFAKSKTIDIDEIQEYYSKFIKGIFVFYTGETFQKINEILFPIMMTKYEEKKLKDLLNNFIYKAFKKSDIGLFNNVDVFHREMFDLVKIEKGNLRKAQYIPNISKYIDKKNLNKFIGRKTDLENIIRKIVETKYEDKVLTIKGAGGIGKTLTTTKAAYELCQRGHFDKGLFFISCDSVNTLENFTYEIGICFDLTSSKELIRQVKENFLYKNRLIILDNFETILYSDDKDQIINLISEICEYATVLITSRQLLKLNFEDVYELRNFTTDEGVELFKSIYKHVSLQEENIVRREIVERLLNNNPLAIKIISKGLVSHKNMTLLQKELETDIFKVGNLELIFEGNEDVNIEKSHSLYHSVNYSYQRLTEKEKVAFELLSLFPDGIHLENFKLFSKTLIGGITIEDKDIKELDNKSLLENNNGRLKLQSIIGRFAKYQFQKREDSYKLSCYENIFEYNAVLADYYSNRGSISNSNILKFQDENINNYLKVLSIFPFLKTNIERKLEYIDDINNIFLSTNQPNIFLKELEKIDSYLKENEVVYKYIQLVKNYTIYWTRDFKNTSVWINENYSFDDLKYGKDGDYIDRLNSYILSSFYFCQGDYLAVMNNKINSNNFSLSIGDALFELGYFSGAEEAYKTQNEKDFFFWELQAANNNLSLSDIDNYIKSIYKKNTLEIVQVTYTKHKMFSVLSDEIKKLPVSNPYTQGLIYVMLAKVEPDLSRKKELYLKAIDNLVYIKYYHCESVYHFSKYLLDNNDEDFEYWFKLGSAEALNYKYNYLSFKFEKLKNDSLIYDEKKQVSLKLHKQISFYLEEYKKYFDKNDKKLPSKSKK